MATRSFSPLCMLLMQLAVIASAASPVLADAPGWHQVALPVPGAARVYGGPAAGCIAGAHALPADGPGYQVIRLSRRRNYGHPDLIDFVQDFGRRMAERKLGIALVGDMAQPRGGPMPMGHASHQTGLDVDIWFRLDLPRQSVAERETPTEVLMADPHNMILNRSRWTRGHGEMVRLAALDRRVDRIFVNPAIKRALCDTTWPDRVWLGKVRPWWGHAGHFHVRLSCPATSSGCSEQKPVPPGEGCDADLQSWFPRHHVEPTKPTTIKPVRRMPVLPEACLLIQAAAGPVDAAGGAE